MRASLDRGGGVSIAWESRGEGAPPLLLLPAWSIAPARIWKLVAPYLSQHHRVITFDGRGAGGSSKPARAADYADDLFAADAAAVLDAAGVEQAVVVGLSAGARWGAMLAARHPERVLGLYMIGPSLQFDPRAAPDFDAVPDRVEGWGLYSRHAWRTQYDAFLAFFFGRMFCEPHCTKQIEDGVGWGREIGAAALELTEDAPRLPDPVAELRRIRCPVAVLHGADDRVVPWREGERAAELTGGAFELLDGTGHAPPGRQPALVADRIRAFADRVSPPPAPGRRRTAPAIARPRRALFVSSPIGLGHVRRDLAIARELRARVAGLEIDWLAQEPTRRALEAAGERVHPASDRLLAEIGIVDAWGGEHELWAFEVIRAMDEVLANNYLVFRDVVRAEPYDLWIGDEAWELDHFLHENPEDKTAAFAWLTDFVGWLPLPEHGEREAALTADLNAEMLEHVARYPRIRDLALFVGEPGDVVGDTFGPGLPDIRTWTEEHFAFTGQIVDAEPPGTRNGAGPPHCLVTAGGSGTGATLLGAAVAAFPLLREQVPGVQMQVVTGPRARIDAAPAEGLQIDAFVPDLGRRLGAFDVALVHGGMSTGMELIAAGRPFVSVPLRRHFEQQRHTRHRLERFGHHRVLDADAATPERLAAELAAALAEPPAYRAVEDTGAARAAELLAALL